MSWTVTQNGGRATIAVRLPRDGKGLYKAHVVGPRGGHCVLGTLTPEGDALALTRTLSVDALDQRGCWPVARVDCALAYAFSQSLPGYGPVPPRLFPQDPLLEEALAGTSGGCYAPRSAGFSLAFPYAPQVPFPLLPVFCFARVCCLAGGLWALFSFDEQGFPQMPRA